MGVCGRIHLPGEAGEDIAKALVAVEVVAVLPIVDEHGDLAVAEDAELLRLLEQAILALVEGDLGGGREGGQRAGVAGLSSQPHFNLGILSLLSFPSLPGGCAPSGWAGS